MLNVLSIFAGLLAVSSALPSGPGRVVERATDVASPRSGNLVERQEALLSCVTSSLESIGDDGDGSVGIELENADDTENTFFFYYNTCEYHPEKYITLGPRETKFVSLREKFQGRVVRGLTSTHLLGNPVPLGTWVEFSFNGKTGSGDVSLIRGCDGAAKIWPSENPSEWRGFDQWVLDGAPDDAYEAKPSGNMVIKATEDMQVRVIESSGVWLGEKVGYDKTYIDDYHGNPVIGTESGKFHVAFYSGRP